MMAEKVELLENTLDADDTTECSFLNESAIRRYNLNECVRYIYQIKGKLQQVSTRIALDEENRPELTKSIDAALVHPLPEKSPLEKVKRKLFLEARKNRKIKRPCKFRSRKGIANFKLFVRNNYVLRERVRRGYLNEARINVERKIQIERLEKFNLNKTLQRFYQNAQNLLRDMLRLRHRARCAMYENLEYGSHLPSGAEMSEFFELIAK